MVWPYRLVGTEPLVMTLTAVLPSTRILAFFMLESVLDTDVMVALVGTSSIG